MPLVRPLCITAGVTALVALSSHALPGEWQSTGVGFCLLVATYVLVLRHDASTIRHYGLGLGGIFEPVPLDVRRILGAIAQSLLDALLAALVFFPLFWIGFVIWWQPSREFGWPPLPGAQVLLTQVLGIAMPEEMFYRGYAQTALDDAGKWRVRVLGAEIGAGLVLGSFIFALGHVLTTGHPARLSVFFPSLVFGWLRAKRTRWPGWGEQPRALSGAHSPEGRHAAEGATSPREPRAGWAAGATSPREPRAGWGARATSPREPRAGWAAGATSPREPRAGWAAGATSPREPRAGWGARAPANNSGIGAAVAFHAACNIFSAWLTDAYFPT